VLDRGVIDRFRERGYVVVDGLLTGEELDHYEPLVRAAVARRKRDAPPLAERTPYAQSFHQCINLWEDFADIRPLTFHPRIAQAAAELIGADALRLWHDQALYKEAGGRATDPHQDHGYWPINEFDTLTAWIPLRGSTIDGGAMGYLPGSHRVGVRAFVNIFAAEAASVLMDRPEIRAIDPEFVEVPRGSVAFHHGLTVHMAKPNGTDADRPVHTVIYFADGCTRRKERWHPSVDRDGIAVDAPIAGPCTPIVWPRAEGDLPPPPPPIPQFVRDVAGAGTLPEP
jgi:ectoine hydroxylase-related dioxygenase (phytanoyl-CoA dioxygenase family)